MKIDFVSFEVSKLLKEIKFDQGVIAHYDKNGNLHHEYYDASYMDIIEELHIKIDDLVNKHTHTNSTYPAPTLYDAQKFLRDVYGIYVTPKPVNIPSHVCEINDNNSSTYWSTEKPTYELALDDGIKHAIKCSILNK